jgi:hypothetical protein
MPTDLSTVYAGLFVSNGSRKDTYGPEVEPGDDCNLPVPLCRVFDEFHGLITMELDNLDIAPWEALDGESVVRSKILARAGYTPAFSNSLMEDVRPGLRCKPQQVIAGFRQQSTNIWVLGRHFILGRTADGRDVDVWAVLVRPQHQQTPPLYVHGIYCDSDSSHPEAPSVLLPPPAAPPSWWGLSRAVGNTQRLAFACPSSGTYTAYHLVLGMIYKHLRPTTPINVWRLLGQNINLPDELPVGGGFEVLSARPLALPGGPSGRRKRQKLLARPPSEVEEDKRTNVWLHMYEIVSPILAEKRVAKTVVGTWRLQQDMRLLDGVERHPERPHPDVDIKQLRRSIERRQHTHIGSMLYPFQNSIRLDTVPGKNKLSVPACQVINIDRPMLVDLRSHPLPLPPDQVAVTPASPPVPPTLPKPLAYNTWSELCEAALLGQ